MISDKDLLEVLAEIHQYSAMLLEAEDETVFGVMSSDDHRPRYFRATKRPRTHGERLDLMKSIRKSNFTTGISQLSFDEFLKELRGRRTRHIWLEEGFAPAKERAFVSISELRVFLRSQER